MLGVQGLGPIALRCAGENATAPRSAILPAGAPPALPVPADPTAIADPTAQLEREAWVLLLSVSGLGPVSFGALLAAFGSARAVLSAAGAPSGPTRLLEALANAVSEPDDCPTGVLFDACARTEDARAPATLGPNAGAFRRRPAIGNDLATRICEASSSGGRAVEEVRALGLTVVTLAEPSYPERLRRVELPPPLLFVRGSVEAMRTKDAVAVVGTRRPTDKGRLIAGWIGSAVARTGAVVVSGLAVGIDGAAHASVVAEGGRTVAVLGGGHARLFPKAHERLAEAIVESGGAVVSEFSPETSPTRGTFPRRNRLVSGLSDATIVVEAGRRSGALITAGWALEQGRECFLVPGAFDSPASAGCHAFLRDFPGQARVVSGIPELIEDLGLDGGSDVATGGPDDEGFAGQSRPKGTPSAAAPRAGRAAVLASLAPVERALAEELARGPATADQLALRTSLAAAAVLSALTLLELRGLATSVYGRYSPAGALGSWAGPNRD